MSARLYHPKFDGLRALAILAVIFEHFVKNDSIGGLGTSLFFCLSGYLITDIILKYRETLSLKGAAIRFYWHRFLRLAPPFYLSIAACFALGIGGTHTTLLADLLYVANFHVFATGSFNESSHFWTLSVEEQFYLVWFSVVFLIPIQRVASITIAAIIGGLIFVGYASLYRIPMAGVLPISSAGLLCSGALLAVALRGNRKILLWLDNMLAFRIVVPAAALIAFDQFNLISWSGPGRAIIMQVAVILCASSLVRHSLCFVECRWLDWLALPSLRHIGKISYGLYIYHFFIPQIFDKFFPQIHSNMANRYYILILIAVSFAVAEVSWRLLERPVLKLKDVRLSRSTLLQPG
jgi:peptidoglycan/LPS O-acetylase OafA/YrhL